MSLVLLHYGNGYPSKDSFLWAGTKQLLDNRYYADSAVTTRNQVYLALTMTSEITYEILASFRTLSSHFFPSQTSQYITPSLYFSRGSEVPFVVYSYPNTRHLNIVNIKLFEPLLPSTSPPDEGNKSIYPVQNRQIQGWEIALGSMSYTDETLETCIMISGGKMIVAGGSKGSLWFLTVRSS